MPPPTGPILADYSEGFLDQMISVVTASTVTTYALYTMSPETVAKFHTRLLPLTLPFVLYGIFRYLYLAVPARPGRQPVRPPGHTTAGCCWTSSCGCWRRSSSSTAPMDFLNRDRARASRPCAGWGRRPVEQRSRRAAGAAPSAAGRTRQSLPRGSGRSYGDAAVPATRGALVLETARADRVLAFDRERGTLTCEAGLSLAEILRVFLPRGWFPPVTPGTRFVTVGGCVACDVHGKNHHRDGSFGAFVDRLVLQVADGSMVECGPHARARALPRHGGRDGADRAHRRGDAPAAAGGDARGWSRRPSRVPGLGAMLDGLRDAAKDWPYTVGWIDCLARGAALGRGILIRGRHATRAEAPAGPPPRSARIRVPLDAPEWLLSPVLMRGFNAAYYRKHCRRRRGTSAARAVSRLLLPARRDRQLESPLRPARLPPVPVRGAARGRRAGRRGAAGAPRRVEERPPSSPSSRTAGRSPTPICPSRSRARRWLSTCRTAAPRTEALVHELNATVIAAGGRVYLAKDAVTRAEDFARDGAASLRVAAGPREVGSRAPLPLRPVGTGARRHAVKAVVVGATRGMGRALARLMAERGDALCLLGRDAGELESSARDLAGARRARAAWPSSASTSAEPADSPRRSTRPIEPSEASTRSS